MAGCFPAQDSTDAFRVGDERTVPTCMFCFVGRERWCTAQIPCSLIVLKGLVISSRKHLDLGTENDELMDITQEALSIKAYLTLRVLFNRWSLKSNNKVGLRIPGVGWMGWRSMSWVKDGTGLCLATYWWKDNLNGSSKSAGWFSSGSSSYPPEKYTIRKLHCPFMY